MSCPFCQHFLQRGRVGIGQRPAVRPDGGRGLRAAEIAVRCGGDGLQRVELCLDAVVLGLQRCDGLGEIRRLPGADLQTVLGQQKAVLRVGDAGILGSVQLIQQVVQRLLRLVCQHRKLTAGRILRLRKQRDGAFEPVQTLTLQALGVIGVAFGYHRAVRHALAILHKIAEIAAARHIHSVKCHNAGQVQTFGQRVADGGLSLVGPMEDQHELDGNIQQEECQCQQTQRV